MNVKLKMGRKTGKAVYFMVGYVSEGSAACCNTVHFQRCTVRNRRTVPIVLSHFPAIDGHEYTRYVVPDLL
jgi:hypothetical protein